MFYDQITQDFFSFKAKFAFGEVIFFFSSEIGFFGLTWRITLL